MTNIELPAEYQPYENVWVCGNTFNKGNVLFEIEKNPVFLIGKKTDSKSSTVWLNFPKPIGGKPKWTKAIDNNTPIEPGFEVFESPEGNEISFKGIPLLQYRIKNGNLLITLINLTPIGLNIFGGLKALTFSGKTLHNNTFENVFTMVGIGG